MVSREFKKIKAVNPFVSVVLATYNGRWCIGNAISSVLSQTYKNFELIVVDDASTDETKRRVLAFNDSRIKYIKNSERRGLTKSLNVGLGEVSGKYVARIDDDDVWIDAEKLKKQIAFLEENPLVGVCGTQHIVIDGDGNETCRLFFAVEDEVIRQKMLSNNQFVHSGVCIRKSALDEVGGYDESLRYAQDFELWLRIGKRYELANISDYCVSKKLRGDSVTSRHNLKQVISYVDSASRYRRDYPGFYRNLPIYSREIMINVMLSKNAYYRLSAIKKGVLKFVGIPFAKQQRGKSD